MDFSTGQIERYKAFFNQFGFLIVPAVFSEDEITAYRTHYMDMVARGQCVGDQAGIIRSKNGRPIRSSATRD